MYFYMPKINKTQSDKKLKLPNIKRRNNRVALLKVHSIAETCLSSAHSEKIHWEQGCENSCFVTKKC